jgi:hypothetical protein
MLSRLFERVDSRANIKLRHYPVKVVSQSAWKVVPTAAAIVRQVHAAHGCWPFRCEGMMVVGVLIIMRSSEQPTSHTAVVLLVFVIAMICG